MKFLLTLIFVLFVLKAIACECSLTRLDDSYRQSTNVVSGKISNVSTYEKDESLLKITIDVYEEFKGTGLNEFYILDPEKAYGMCNVYLHKGQELLFYLMKSNKGLLMTDYCIRLFPLKYLNKYPLELEILRKVKEYDLNYTSMFFVDDYQNEFFYSLRRIESSALIPKIGIFEVQIDGWNYWTDAKVIKGFGEEIDQEILKLIKESEWILDTYYEDPIPSIARFFIVIENEYLETNDTYYLNEYNFQ